MKKFLGEELTNGKTLYRESLVKLEKMIESLSGSKPLKGRESKFLNPIHE